CGDQTFRQKPFARQAGRLAALGRNALGKPGDCDQARHLINWFTNDNCQGCQCLLSGVKRTCTVELQEPAFGVRADIFGSKETLRLRRSQIAISCPLLGVKRTWAGAVHMSAFDPKRTWAASVAPLGIAAKWGNL